MSTQFHRRRSWLSRNDTWLFAMLALAAMFAVIAAVAFEEGVRFGFEQARTLPAPHPLPHPLPHHQPQHAPLAPR